MPIQYLYPTTINVENGNDYTWYENGNATLIKTNGETTEEIDEGFSTVNYSDFLQSRVIFNPGLTNYNILSTNMTRNYIVPSSIICNLSCSSIFNNSRPISTYYSGKAVTISVRNKNNGELVAFGGSELGSGLLNLSIPLSVLSRQIAPIDYKIDMIFGNVTTPIDFSDYFSPKVYAFELITSGSIQSKESDVPLTILGGLDTSNYKRIVAYDDNVHTSIELSDTDWETSRFVDYAESYHRHDISGHFNTAYFQFNEGSGNVVRSGSKSGQIFSEDNQYRWLTDGTITDNRALLENTSNIGIGLYSGQVLQNSYARTDTQGNGLYLGPTSLNNYQTTNYSTESLSRLQGIDFYNPLTSSGNFSLYLNMGHITLKERTVDNTTTYENDDGCVLFSNDSFETRILGGILTTTKRDTNNSVITSLSSDYVINSLIYTYNSGLLTTYILYEGNTNWATSSALLSGINCFGKLQIGRQDNNYLNYHYLTLHQFGVCDYALSSTEVDSILEKINAPVNNVILRQGLHSVQTYASGDNWVGVSYQKSVKNTNDKTHLLTNRIIFNDSQVYSIPSSGYVFMDAYVAYTGNNPSGYLGITAQANIDGNNINPRWNTDSTVYQHKVFNSGGIQRISIGDIWEDTNPYPFKLGAAQPFVKIFVTTPPSNSFYDGGEFRLYGLEFYTDSAFYVEPTGVANSIPLYTYGSLPSSGSLDLFCGQDESFDSLNLFVKANEPVANNNNLPLFLLNGGSGTTTNTCNLYTKNQPALSGELPLYIYCDYSPPNPSSGNLNLFLYGGIYPTGSVPLYIKNNTVTTNKSVNLFISSATPESGYLGLNISGGGIDYRNGTLSLLTYNTTSSSGGVSLFTHAGQAYSTLPLIVGSRSGLVATDNVELTIFSSAESGFFGSIPLTLLSDNFNSNMNLYIQNQDSTGNIGSLNLFINNDSTHNNYCTLYISNTNGTVNSGVNFYVAGDGVNQGAFVGTGSVNLFINREIESIGNGLHFNISGPSGIMSSVPLIISGGNMVNNSCTLSLPATLGIPSGYTTMFTHGY